MTDPWVRLGSVRVSFLTVILATVLFGRTPPASATIGYQISLANPEQHLFHVTMTIPEVSGEVLVAMPAWDALYQVRDFSAHVERVEAFSPEGRAAIEKIDKQTWRISGNGEITVKYATYWDEGGPFATQLNGEHAFINPAMILLYAPKRREEGVELCLAAIPPGWKTAEISTGDTSDKNAGCESAASYDALADAPIEAGSFEQFVLPGMQPEIRVVIHGDNWKKKRVEEELTKICKYELQLMGGAPYPSYTFILHLGKGAAGGGGGMEHANGTAISTASDEYLASVAAHEFFHLWNVKRIRPATLDPVDYTKEQYTRALWFAEGVTSAYGSYTLLRAGLWNKQDFYADLGQQIYELEARPAEKWQSAEQSSLDAWLEKYSLYNRGDESVSYYTKGQILGVLLDILIRDRTGNAKSLDDVLRAMNTDFAKAGKTYQDSLDVRLTAERVAGGSFADFFSKYVAGTESLPYERVLALAGLDLRTLEHKRATLGFLAERDGSGAVVVRSVEGGGPAAQSGLHAEDVILSWNGGDAPRRPERWVAGQRAGSELSLRVRRGEKEITIETRLGEVADVQYAVAEAQHPSAEARRVREGLLHGTTSPMRTQTNSGALTATAEDAARPPN